MRSDKFNRKIEFYENQSEKFRLLLKANENQRGNIYKCQYNSLYMARLKMLGPRIFEAARKKFGQDLSIVSLSDLETNKPSLIVGTIVKQQKLRPSVVIGLMDEVGDLPQPVESSRGSYSSSSDFIELEDERQIIRLEGDINPQHLVTGVVAGIFGRKNENDSFLVESIIFAPVLNEGPPQKRIGILNTSKDTFVMFISGLVLSGRDQEDARVLLSLNLLQRWLCGQLPTTPEQTLVISRVCRLVVAGENISHDSSDRLFSSRARYLTRHELDPSVHCVHHVDSFLAKITPLLPVDLMPGDGDPSNHLLPQQPMHRCMFSQAGQFGPMLNLVTNPYQCEINGRTILGTSGQNLADLLRLSADLTPVDLLENSLKWQHICPSAPDTTDMFPYKDTDPFVMDGVPPDIYFAGNQSHLAHKLVDNNRGRRILILCLPRFKSTFATTLVNLNTLQVISQDFTVECDEIDHY